MVKYGQVILNQLYLEFKSIESKNITAFLTLTYSTCYFIIILYLILFVNISLLQNQVCVKISKDCL